MTRTIWKGEIRGARCVVSVNETGAVDYEIDGEDASVGAVEALEVAVVQLHRSLEVSRDATRALQVVLERERGERRPDAKAEPAEDAERWGRDYYDIACMDETEWLSWEEMAETSRKLRRDIAERLSDRWGVRAMQTEIAALKELRARDHDAYAELAKMHEAQGKELMAERRRAASLTKECLLQADRADTHERRAKRLQEEIDRLRSERDDTRSHNVDLLLRIQNTLEILAVPGAEGSLEDLARMAARERDHRTRQVAEIFEALEPFATSEDTLAAAARRTSMEAASFRSIAAELPKLHEALHGEKEAIPGVSVVPSAVKLIERLKLDLAEAKRDADAVEHRERLGRMLAGASDALKGSAGEMTLAQLAKGAVERIRQLEAERDGARADVATAQKEAKNRSEELTEARRLAKEEEEYLRGLVERIGNMRRILGMSPEDRVESIEETAARVVDERNRLRKQVADGEISKFTRLLDVTHERDEARELRARSEAEHKQRSQRLSVVAAERDRLLALIAETWEVLEPVDGGGRTLPEIVKWLVDENARLAKIISNLKQEPASKGVFEQRLRALEDVAHTPMDFSGLLRRVEVLEQRLGPPALRPMHVEARMDGALAKLEDAAHPVAIIAGRMHCPICTNVEHKRFDGWMIVLRAERLRAQAKEDAKAIRCLSPEADYYFISKSILDGVFERTGFDPSEKERYFTEIRREHEALDRKPGVVKDPPRKP